MNKYIYNHEKLEIYQLSRKLIRIVYKLALSFPKEEKYNLTNQSKRSVVSICLNIAEGNAKFYPKEQAKFADNALSSLIELKTCIDIALDLKYIIISDLKEFYKTVEKLYFKIVAYKKSKFKISE